MNVRDAAVYLTAKGYRCSAGTVRALARAGRLLYYRPGLSGKGRMEFSEGQLDAFLRSAEIGGAEASRGKTPRPPRAPAVVPAPKAAGDDWKKRYDKVKGA